MSNERKLHRDKPSDSTRKETPDELPTARQATDSKRRRFRMSKKFRSRLLATGIPDVLPVTCGDARGELHVKKIGSGSRSPCVCSDGVWLTPNQFENEGGHCFTKCWKRTIQHGRTPLNTYIKLGLIKLHRQYCNCELCSSPIVDTGRNSITKLKKPRKKRKKRNSKFNDRNDDTFEVSEGTNQVQATRRNEKEIGNLGKDCVQSDPLHDKNRDHEGQAFLMKKDATLKELGTESDALADQISSERRARKRQWQDDEKCSDEELDFSRLSSTENPEKMRCDGSEDGRDTTEQTTHLRLNSRRSPTDGYRLQLSRDMQLVASATATLKKDGREKLRATQSDCIPLSDRCLRSFSRTTGRSPIDLSDISTPYFHHDASPSNLSDDSIGSIRDCSHQAPSRYSGDLKERVDSIKQKAGLASCDVDSWSVDQVAGFLSVAGFRFQSDLFRHQLINGEALLSLQDRHLVENLKMKLGTSLRLMALIQCLVSMQS